MRWRRGVVTVSVLVVCTLGGLGCSDGGDPEVMSADGPSTTAADPASTATTAPSASGTPSPSPDELQAFADELVSSTASDGGIVAIQRDDEPPIVVASGIAPGPTTREIHVTDAFHVASVTKSYVAAALVSLAAEGAVDLDAPISTWIDWPNGDVITIRHLLQHTSGISGFGNDEPSLVYAGMVVAEGREYTLPEVLDATRELPPAGELGTSTYSNLNFVLGAAIIEAATDRPVADVVTERVFEPVGMDSTWYPGDARPRPEPLPGIYDLQSGAEPISTADFSMASWETLTAGGSGAISTMDDYVAWGNEVFRDQRLDEADLAVMSEIGPNGYGLGVVGVAADGACVFDGCEPGTEFTRLALNGDIPGSSTRLMYDPATDTMLAVYLNRNALSLDGPMIAFLEEHGNLS